MIEQHSGTNDFGENSYSKGGYYRRPVKRTKGPGFAEILKYFILAGIVGYIVFLMIFTSGSTKPFEQIEKAVEDSLDMENLKKADVQGLKRYYGLNSADYDGVMLYTSKSSISTEEVLLIKVKHDGQMQQVEDAVQERIESRKNAFQGYAPKQVKLLEQAQISVRGKYLFLAVSSKAESYKEAFMKSL
ncbi:MAG: DUF4358 domain-containing protein [Muricomes sp.]